MDSHSVCPKSSTYCTTSAINGEGINGRKSVFASMCAYGYKIKCLFT